MMHTRSNIFTAMFFSLAVTSTALAEDVASLKQSIENRICPNPIVTYNLETYSKKCGKHDVYGSDDYQKQYGACQLAVEADNKVIFEYNDFVRKNCRSIHSNSNTSSATKSRVSGNVTYSSISHAQNIKTDTRTQSGDDTQRRAEKNRRADLCADKEAPWFQSCLGGPPGFENTTNTDRYNRRESCINEDVRRVNACAGGPVLVIEYDYVAGAIKSMHSVVNPNW